MSAENLIYTLLGLPLLASALVLVFRNHPNLRDGQAVLLGILSAGAAFQLYLLPTGASLTLVELAPGLTLTFTPEPLGKLFALVAGTLWPLATLYTIGYMRGAKEANHTRFMFFYAVAIHATMGIALSGNLLTLFVFYEMLTFSTYPLVTHKGDEAALKAGRVYLGILVASSIVFLLFGVIGVWAIAGTLDFTSGGILVGKIDPFYVPALLALFAFGIGKAALMPLHRWLPAAMVAPTPVSALLHAVAVVKAGVFTVLKVGVYIFGIDFLKETGGSEWLVWVASFSILAASIVAMTKTNLKARLAYSTVSQLGYIVMGTALATPLAASGAALHIAAHGAGKITLFFCAGAIYVAHKRTDIRDMNGLGRTMPITYTAFALAALSIMGVPPLAGAWSKFMLMGGALDNGYLVVLGVLMVSSLLNLVYLGEIVVRGFFATPKRKLKGVQEAPIAMLIPLSITAFLSLALFFAVDLFIIDFGG
ncbi:MAG: monovalent cation/H+ antiporter subunit D family protein [Rhodobiaceae bacterium]|jgi:multicomponent Na+:H+ antiporter subunit D|nr:monovalent cation/H+ antiporter subunit D family protein [Rhodobiaceae bacterium]